MSKKKIVIIGAGGHGRVVADIARLNGYDDILFLDDDPANKKLKIAGPVSEYNNFLEGYDFFVAIGNNATREKLTKIIDKAGANIVTLVHPAAVVCENVKMGRGCVVMACAVINTDAIIGEGVIVNTCSSVDHDCEIGDFTHVSVGAHVSGTVKTGKRVFLCAGATVANNLGIVDDCVIGAGAVVVKDIEKSGLYVGVPARMKK